MDSICSIVIESSSLFKTDDDVVVVAAVVADDDVDVVVDDDVDVDVDVVVVLVTFVFFSCCNGFNVAQDLEGLLLVCFDVVEKDADFTDRMRPILCAVGLDLHCVWFSDELALLDADEDVIRSLIVRFTF